jgi:hypothetical protein
MQMLHACSDNVGQMNITTAIRGALHFTQIKQLLQYSERSPVTTIYRGFLTVASSVQRQPVHPNFVCDVTRTLFPATSADRFGVLHYKKYWVFITQPLQVPRVHQVIW